MASGSSGQIEFRFSATIQQQFEEFHARHPEVEKELLRMCYLLQSRGITHHGIGSLWEVLRWNMQIERDGDFKLNNNFRSRYARLIIQEHPEFENFFELRELRTE